MSLLFNPHRINRSYPDKKSRAFIDATIKFFESQGRQKLRDAYHTNRWYDEFLAHSAERGLLATSLTPRGWGDADARWDTWRNSEFGEILGFYGLEYWYTWQVSMLGVGPIWMSKNEAIKARTAELLRQGAIFAFGLSEREHGADIYASEMRLTRQSDGSYLANGSKYYIGNGNKAAIVSTFGKLADTDEYVFFAVRTDHSNYHCTRKITESQSYVAAFDLRDYPVRAEDIIERGAHAWDAALNTVNICKYNLGWASVGICTHALYEAVDHAAGRRLYNRSVTDFPHVRQGFVDAYSRLIAMKLFCARAADYMRASSAQDRRYLLFNPMVKMKVTTQGEEVINLLWDIIAAKGFEKDMYFQEAAIAIRALPKLEGTVHVNIQLIVKFMSNYFFGDAKMPTVPRRDDAQDDTFLFNQGTTKGLSGIVFPDFTTAYADWRLPCVQLFLQQARAFRGLLQAAPPTEGQRQDTAFLLALGNVFALVVYAQLILENARIYELSEDEVDQIFDFMVRDMAQLATELHGKPGTSTEQATLVRSLIVRPEANVARFERVWGSHVVTLRHAYQPLA